MLRFSIDANLRCISTVKHHTAEQYSKMGRTGSPIVPQNGWDKTPKAMYDGILVRTSSGYQVFELMLWK